MLLLFLLGYGCTADQQEFGLQAERSYVDLLYALQAGDQPGSLAAAAALDRPVRELRQRWYRPRPADELDRMRYHVDLAECAYEDARESIEDGQLDWAMVQLDRAVYELRAGDQASLEELYVGSIYDFVAAWLEVDYLLRDPAELPSGQLLGSCSRDARRAWRAVKGTRPATDLYFDRGVDRQAFAAAHATLNGEVEAFYRAAQGKDQTAIRALGHSVSEAMWDLLLLFASPRPAPGGVHPM
ncbi:hypothetical protein GGR26_002968 [Lewinella marina]|nr:hypothetical protein [Neolewinella marina]NJB87191.1 hypothetical protein [Neolewinella marina]